MIDWDQLFIKLQGYFPHYLLSKLAYQVGSCRNKAVKDFLIQKFITHYQVDLDLAYSANFDDYPTFNDFFIRKLKSSARPINNEPGAIVSPADGRILAYGEIQDEQIFQAKNHNYDLTALLGGRFELCEHFRHGNYLTLYLSPKDYHRVHIPAAGKLEEMHYIPGRLFAVKPQSVANIPAIFARNERVINIFSTDQGKMAVILVGAMFVGSMATVWHGEITPPHGGSGLSVNYKKLAEKIFLQRGDELGHFKFGSTVILLFEKNRQQFIEDLKIEQAVQMGQLIARAVEK